MSNTATDPILTDEARVAAAREEQAKKFDAIANQATQIIQHARAAAEHFRNGQVPRAGIHALALQGHLVVARNLFDRIALTQATRTRALASGPNRTSQ